MTDNDLERYIELYGKNVYSAALCYVKNPNDADDITQDVFLKLYTYGGTFENDEHVKAWLLRCAINGSKNLLRSYWHRFSRPISDAENKTCTDSDTDDLLPLVMKLGKNNRTVMYMYYYEGYTTEEIAKMLGISKSAVTTRLMRGRNRLKKLIAAEREDPDYGNEFQRNI